MGSQRTILGGHYSTHYREERWHYNKPFFTSPWLCTNANTFQVFKSLHLSSSAKSQFLLHQECFWSRSTATYLVMPLSADHSSLFSRSVVTKLVKTDAGPNPQHFWQWFKGAAPNFAFLTSFLVMLMLMLHVLDHTLRITALDSTESTFSYSLYLGKRVHSTLFFFFLCVVSD